LRLWQAPRSGMYMFQSRFISITDHFADQLQAGRLCLVIWSGDGRNMYALTAIELLSN